MNLEFPGVQKFQRHVAIMKDWITRPRASIFGI